MPHLRIKAHKRTHMGTLVCIYRQIGHSLALATLASPHVRRHALYGAVVNANARLGSLRYQLLRVRVGSLRMAHNRLQNHARYARIQG